MLTGSEKQWLKCRGYNTFCDNHCNVPYSSKECCVRVACKTCPLYPGLGAFRDAAEFSERVAAKLADWFGNSVSGLYTVSIDGTCDGCPCGGNCTMPCKAEILKHARMKVEEEMNSNGQ